AKPNEPDSHFRGNDGILGFCFCRNDEILSFRNLSEKNRNRSAVIPAQAGIRTLEQQQYSKVS
ncbi:TPA: hypothetical protein ACK4W6_002105, partial [Neisseria gonorrhoeae]